MRKIIKLFFIPGAITLICCSCNITGKNKPEWKPAEHDNRPPFIHIVKFPAETLQIISEWYTGDIKNWEIITNANPSLNNEKVASGTRIYIPENLLKTTEPLTEEYIEAHIQKSRPIIIEEKKEPVSKPEPPPARKKVEEFDLIGPK